MGMCGRRDECAVAIPSTATQHAARLQVRDMWSSPHGIWSAHRCVGSGDEGGLLGTAVVVPCSWHRSCTRRRWRTGSPYRSIPWFQSWWKCVCCVVAVVGRVHRAAEARERFEESVRFVGSGTIVDTMRAVGSDHTRQGLSRVTRKRHKRRAGACWSVQNTQRLG